MTDFLTFDIERMRLRLEGLDTTRRVLFGLSCCERLFPNYVQFEQQQGWGDVNALRTSLDVVWEAVSGRPCSPSTLGRLRTQIENAEPDTEDFETTLVSSALDAAVAAGIALSLINDPKSEYVADIASICVDTVDMFIQTITPIHPLDPKREDIIGLHPLMQAELQRQQDDLACLAKLLDVSQDIGHLRALWRNPSVSNIGLSRTGQEPSDNSS